MLNPYLGLDWEKSRVSTNPHMHVNNQAAFDSVYSQGVRHFAVTRYHPSIVCYPLKDFYNEVPSDAIGAPNTEHYGMTNITGRFHYTNPGSLYESGDGVGGTWQHAFGQSIQHLQHPDGGGIIIAHPVWTGLEAEQIGTLLDFSDVVLGMEVVHHITSFTSREEMDAYVEQHLVLWDAVLSTGRQCFGFGVRDHGSTDSPSWWGHTHLVCDPTEFDCLRAYRLGHSYFSVENGPLRFDSLTVSQGRLNVVCSEPADIVFVTDSGRAVVERASTASYDLTGDEVFVRVELKSGSQWVFSQPIITTTKRDLQRERRRKVFMLL